MTPESVIENSWVLSQPRMRAKFRLFHSLFKKEVALQAGSGFALVNRLFFGPLIGLATTGILYSSFFTRHPNSSLGDLSGENYLIFVGFGFLMHTYLNAGYYCFAYKLLAETYHGTLQMIWIAPCHRLLSLASLAGLEVAKCVVVLFAVMGLAGAPHGPLWEAVFLQFMYLGAFLPLCLSLGAVRAILTVVNSDLADLMDHGYLVFSLTACPYIPSELLPRILRPLCELNPAYHMAYLMRGAWKHEFLAKAHLVPLLAFTAVFFMGGYLLWRRHRTKVFERCFV